MKYKISVSKASRLFREFEGRIVGIISNKETNAIINTKGAAKKVFTSESLNIDDVYSNGFNNRIVFATNNINNKRVIIITPPAKFITKHFVGKDKFITFKTNGDLEYKIFY